MNGDARDLARTMVEILASYQSATDGLLEAVAVFDEPAIDSALERRGRDILLFRQAVEGWRQLPLCDQDVSLCDQINGHIACINETDADLMKRVLSMKETVGAELLRMGTLRKVDRAYLPAAEEMLRIVNGKG